MRELAEGRIPEFHSYDSYGNFSVSIDGNVYDFNNTDAASHNRWHRMLQSKNPQLRWKAFREVKMSSQPAHERISKKPSQKQLSFRGWMRENSEDINEAIMKFGQKFLDRNVNEVPASMWQWTLNKMKESPNWVPRIQDDNGQIMDRNQVITVAQMRIGGQSYGDGGGGLPQQPMQPQQVQAPRTDQDFQAQGYIKLTSKYNSPAKGIKAGDEIWWKRGEPPIPVNQPQPEQPEQPPETQPEQPAMAPQPTEQPTQRGRTVETGRNGESIVIPPEHMSQYNSAIEDRFSNSADPIMINALAGTGKTTMLKHLSSFIQPGERWLYLVFNKKNQVEANQEFPDGVDVLTTHAYLGRVLKANGKDVGGKTNLPPQGVKWTKINRLLDELVPKGDQTFGKFRWGAVSRIRKIANLAKAFAVDPNSPNIQQDLMGIINKYNIDMDLSTERLTQDRDYTPDMLQKVHQLLQISLPGQLPQQFGSQFADIRDQDDTLWYAAIHADQIRWNANPHYNVVLMDEVQDFNQSQLVMAQKLKESGARLVGVGDPNQAMYLFRGADSEAFDKLGEIITGGQSDNMDLPINFRSDPKVIEFATQNTHVKDLQANPKLDPNAGEATTQFGYDDFVQGVVDNYGKDRQLKHSTAFIARTNAPLASAAMNLLKNNIDFQILGRDLSQELKRHIKKVTWAKPQNYDITDLADLFFDHYAEVQQKWQDKVSKQDELKEIEQTTEALTSVLAYLGEQGWQEEENGSVLKTGMDFIGFIDRKLGGLDPDNERDAAKLKQKDPRSYITLTTAHKSNGLEWDSVFVMKPDEFSPNKPNIRTPEEAQQERNAWFVALTRAKHSINVSADDKP